MKAVLVTTQYRGVFFGYVSSEKELPKRLTLKNARNVIYWAATCNGFLGLASTGPNKDCKIGSKVEELTIFDITSVSPVSDSAIKIWEDLK